MKLAVEASKDTENVHLKVGSQILYVRMRNKQKTQLHIASPFVGAERHPGPAGICPEQAEGLSEREAAGGQEARRDQKGEHGPQGQAGRKRQDHRGPQGAAQQRRKGEDQDAGDRPGPVQKGEGDRREGQERSGCEHHQDGRREKG